MAAPARAGKKRHYSKAGLEAMKQNLAKARAARKVKAKVDMVATAPVVTAALPTGGGPPTTAQGEVRWALVEALAWIENHTAVMDEFKRGVLVERLRRAVRLLDAPRVRSRRRPRAERPMKTTTTYDRLQAHDA